MAVLPILPPAVAPLLPAVWSRVARTPAARLAIGFHLTGRRLGAADSCGCGDRSAEARAIQRARTPHPARRTVPARQMVDFLAAAGVVGSRIELLQRECLFDGGNRPSGLLVNLWA